MKNSSNRERLARKVCDGESVDWSTLTDSADQEDVRWILDLRAVSMLSSFHLRTTEKEGKLPPDAPSQWGSLRLWEKIGEGSFGEVYRAWDPQLEREVALKLYRPEKQSSEAHRSLLREGRLLARLRHANVATVYGADRHDNRVGIWMELVRGRNLAELIREEGCRSPAETIAIGIDLCLALAEVHRHGLVHRDVKAENVMREDQGRIVLMDFGLVQAQSQNKASSKRLSGTPLYMAPELLMGTPASPASDIYALGVVLFHALTAAFPVEGGSIEQLSGAHSKRRLRLGDLRPDLPVRLIDAIEKALSPNPDARQHTAAAVADDLLLCLAPKSQTWVRGLVPATLAVALLVLVALFLTVWEAPPRARSGPVRVMVGEFSNQTGDHDFDLTPRDLLAASLGDEPSLSILPRETVRDTLRFMRLAPDTQLTDSLYRQIAVRRNVDWFLTGSVEKNSSGYLVHTESWSITGPSTTGRRQMSFDGKDLFIPALAELSSQIRSDLLGSGPSGPRSPPRAPVTTRSLKAFRYFSEALDFHSRGGGIEEAIDLLKASVREDPEFAMGWARLAVYENGIGMENRALEAIDRAYELREMTSERERYYIEALYHLYRLRYETALGFLETLTRVYPSDPNAHRQLALLNANLLHPEGGLLHARAARELHKSVINYGVHIVLLAEAGKTTEALQLIAQARDTFSVPAKEPLPTYLYWGQGLALMMEGNREEANQAFQHLAASPAPVYQSNGRLFLGRLESLEGRLSGALDVLQIDVDFYKARDLDRSVIRRLAYPARLLSWLGRSEEALRRIELIRQRPDFPASLRHFRDAGVLLIELNRPDLAEELLDRMRKLRERYDSQLARAFVQQIEAELFASRGDMESALRSIDSALLERTDASVIRSAARLHMAANHLTQAVPYWQQFLKRKGELFRSDLPALWVIGHLELARCLRDLGKPTQAASYYHEFLSLWENADQDIELLNQARREIAGLDVLTTEPRKSETDAGLVGRNRPGVSGPVISQRSSRQDSTLQH